MTFVVKYILRYFLFTIILTGSLTTFAQHGDEPDAHNTPAEKELNAGDMIMEHIADSYEWHIATIGETHISVPLPILVYSKHTGFHAFMSSKFHHGHDAYENLKIAGEDSENKGKIVEIFNGQEIRPYDISITKNTLAMFVSIAILLLVFLSVAKAYNRREKKAPKGLQSFLEPLILFIRDDIAKASIAKNPEKFTPFLLTIFFFIFLNNIMGLIPIFPGGANLTGNIAITMVLALFTFVITTVNANLNYWKHIVNTPGVPWWLKLPVPLMPVIETIGVFTKPFVLMIRLFANIMAGHIVVLGFFSIIFVFGAMSVVAGYGVSVLSIIFTVFLTFLEILVAFIQAYVFTLLSALYFGMATEEGH
ncbi:MAG: F0F1 ATP synthase subunit A [Bacteroidota bacterium]|nr:F0F1 ATP synthase subunit A [Bacteroidota bacterium]